MNYVQYGYQSCEVGKEFVFLAQRDYTSIWITQSEFKSNKNFSMSVLELKFPHVRRQYT